jgi:hypothetical protein
MVDRLHCHELLCSALQNLFPTPLALSSLYHLGIFPLVSEILYTTKIQNFMIVFILLLLFLQHLSNYDNIIAILLQNIGLSLEPLIGAIAAGNTVVLKPSELAPSCSAILAKNIPIYMDNNAVKVVQGGPPIGEQLLQQKWDKIFFTGKNSRKVQIKIPYNFKKIVDPKIV